MLITLLQLPLMANVGFSYTYCTYSMLLKRREEELEIEVLHYWKWGYCVSSNILAVRGLFLPTISHALFYTEGLCCSSITS